MARPLIVCVIGTLACGAGSDPGVAATVGGVEVSHPVMPAPVTPDVGAVYFTLRNTGTTADTLVAISTPAAVVASLHTVRPHGGMRRMEPLPAVALPPGVRVVLAPGGLHVMLQALARPPVPGDTVILTLRFRRAGSAELRVPVVPYAELERYVETGQPGEAGR